MQLGSLAGAIRDEQGLFNLNNLSSGGKRDRLQVAALGRLGADAPADLGVVHRNAARWPAVVAMGAKGVNAPLTSSAGRLFDAAAAILGVRDAINYEGQAAVELEQLADPGEAAAYGTGLKTGQGPFQACGADLLHAIVDDLTDRVPAPVIAARFHHGVAAMIEEGCVYLRERHGLNTVALSGGVFLNALLTALCVDGLAAAGFTVLRHRLVPPSDAGLALGQLACAAREESSCAWPCPAS